MRVTIFGVAATILLSCWTPRAMTQPPGRVLNDLALRRAMRIPTFGDMAVSVIRKGMQARDIVTSETRGVRDQYSAAKDRFWESYPDAPCSVQQEFVAALKRRDNLEITLSLFPAYMTRMLGAEPMSGISEAAKPAFRLWADRVKEFSDEGEQKAHQLRYLVARDFEEFRLAGRTPQGLGETWPIMLAAVEAAQDKSIKLGPDRLRPHSIPLAYPYLEALEIVDVFGSQRVVSLFNRFAGDSGPWEAPADSGELLRDKIPFFALLSALEGGSDREYMIKQIRDTLGGKHWLFGWRHAAAEYEKLVDEKGESAVTAAIQRVRGALREQANQRSLGNETFNAWAQLGCTIPGLPVPHGGAMGCIRVLLGLKPLPPAFSTRVRGDRLLSDEEVLRFELEQLPAPETSGSPGCDAQVSEGPQQHSGRLLGSESLSVTVAMDSILGLRPQDFRSMMEAANTQRAYMEEVPGFGKLTHEVLLCRYEGGSRGESTVYFWRDSSPLPQESVAKLSENHPFRRIGPGRAACPANTSEAKP